MKNLACLITIVSLASIPCWARAGTSSSTVAKAAEPQVSRPALSVGLAEAWFVAFDAQYRPRFVGDTGRDFVSAGEAAYVNHRARLGVTLGHDSGVSVTARVQDVRIWGEEDPNTLNDFSAGGLDLHEAFASLQLFEALTVTLGRQEIAFDNHRLIGTVDWTQRARSFDAVRLRADLELAAFDLFYAKAREADRDPDGSVPDGRSADTDVVALHVQRDLAKGHRLAALYIFNGDYTARNERHTAGLFGAGAVESLRYTGELFFQFGDDNDDSVSAFLGAASLGYSIAAPLEPSLTAWGEFLSGDGTRAGTFDTLYATNHKFYGEMDFFLNIPVHTGMLGLIDVGGRAACRPAGFLVALVDFHHLRPVEDGGGAFGNEIDLKLVATAMDHVALRALYGIFLPDAAIESRFSLNQGDSQVEHFVYVTTDVKF